MRITKCFRLTTLVACAVLTNQAQAVTIIDDDLNTDTSGDYSLVSLGTDGTVTFEYDYSGIVGPAPRTTDASTKGIRFTANDTLGTASAFTLFHQTPVPANARVTVDLYLGVTGTGGTTEYGSVGLGSTGNTPFTIYTPTAGDGTYLSTNGDGGSLSDWRYSRPRGTDPSASVPVNSNEPDYLFGGTDASHYTGVLPPDGIAGNEWVTITVETNNGQTSAFINDTLIIQGPSIGDLDGPGTGGIAPGGLASMSYADVFTSIASPFQSQFGIFDNFLVETVPPGPRVHDGGFELGVGGVPFSALQNPFWSKVSSDGTPLCNVALCGTGTGTGPHTGDWWAWFNENTPSMQSISQPINFPVGTAELSFWFENIISDSSSDFIEARIDGVPVWTYNGEGPLDGILGYTEITVNLDSFADGNLHTLEFFGQTFGNNGGLSNFFVDDVSIAIPEPLVGDFNGDGSVDGFDFLTWQRDPSVGDLSDWEANYGASESQVASAAVPEPTGFALALAALGLVARRRG
jgi:hypothetical protein